MSVHAGVQAFCDIFRKRVRRHGDDRDRGRPRILQRADIPCGIQSVHDRHLDIHEDKGVLSAFRRLHLVDAYLTVLRALRHDSKHPQHGGDDLPVDVVILRDENAYSGKVGVIILRLRRLRFRSQKLVDLIIQL